MSTSFLIAAIVILTVFVIYLYIVKAGLETAYGVASSGWRQYQDNHQLQVSINTDLQKKLNVVLRESSDHKELLANLRADLRAARTLVREKQAIINDYTLSPITAIKFTAHVPTAGWIHTEFKLGKGPCGKEVTAIHWVEKDDRYELTQTCTDGERKEFIYYKKDVEGRIEIAYKANTTHYSDKS